MTQRLEAQRPEAQERVLRQLVESLIYEGLLTPEVAAGRWTVRRRFSYSRATATRSIRILIARRTR